MSPISPVPDVVVRRDPEHGITATFPRRVAAADWLMRGFNFHPLPDRPGTYAMTDPHRDGDGRAERMTAMLGRASYTVDTSLAEITAEPDVAFAQHPMLGVIAATGPAAPSATGQVLARHGWHHHRPLDVYLHQLPGNPDTILGNLNAAMRELRETGAIVVAETGLLEDAQRALGTTPAPAQTQDLGRSAPMRAAALARSPAQPGLPARPPAPVPATTPLAASVRSVPRATR